MHLSIIIIEICIDLKGRLGFRKLKFNLRYKNKVVVQTPSELIKNNKNQIPQQTNKTKSYLISGEIYEK